MNIKSCSKLIKRLKLSRVQSFLFSEINFITAPECSQLFGEMIAIFLYKVIESFHFPQTLDLIEIGGGTGHLMADILNTFYDFNLLKCLNIKMIEKSEKLQKVQQETVFERLAKRNIYMQYIFDEVIC